MRTVIAGFPGDFDDFFYQGFFLEAFALNGVAASFVEVVGLND